MRSLIRVFLVLLALVVMIPLASIYGIFITMNTADGRHFAVTEINHFCNGQISVTGLAGHFPADIKLAHIEVLDKAGPWLTADDLELRWQPKVLLARNLHVISLTARDVFAIRAPVYAAGKAKENSGPGLPKLHLSVDHIAIGALHIAASLAGEQVTLAVSGSGHLENAGNGDAVISAIAANGKGEYTLSAAIDGSRVNTALRIAEPPNGLIGHFSGARVNAPLRVDLALAGARANAALNFTASLGSARLNGSGTLDLTPDSPKADVVVSIPALAPLGEFAGQAVAGSTTLHLIAAEAPDQSTTISLNGGIALTAGPGAAARLVGPNGHLAMVVTLAHQDMSIRQLDINGAGFSAAIGGHVTRIAAAPALQLHTELALTDIAALSPGLTGAVAENGTISGSAQDFAVAARITGNIAAGHKNSGPFTVTLDARHLPKTPDGTLTASGSLEAAPLQIDAAFARDASGNAMVTISKARWRSLSAQAALALAAGATLPTGTAKFAVTRLGDFSAFAPVPLGGSITGEFSHATASDFTLDLTARKLLAAPAIGPIDVTLHAHGPVNELAVKLNFSLAKLFSAPARIGANAILNLDRRAVTISALSASWHGLNARLAGTAAVQTQPGLTIRHLALALNGGVIKLDGALTPRLNATLAVQDLPASLAGVFAPGIQASGTLNATAAVTGTADNPAGRVTVNADAIRLHSGPASALAPAGLAGVATIANHAATIALRLTAGPRLALNATGTVPLNQTGPIDLHLTGAADLRLTDPILAAEGTTLRGVVTPDVTLTGTPGSPQANGTVTLAGGSVENIGSGLNLTNIAAAIDGNGRMIALREFSAIAGGGSITGHGSVDLGQPSYPVDLALSANNATPVASDIVTETLDAALDLKGALRGAMALSGSVDLRKANINIPRSLPPSVANLPIVNRGAPVPPPPPPPPPVALDLTIRANDQIFVRGDGLFAELGGKLRITGTAAAPDPEGGFTLIRGDISLAGKNLQFTQGAVGFNGAGFMPTLDLEATSPTPTMTATLIVGGTAAAPTITLTSTPPAPSDAILAQLLFGTGTQNLTAFQAASLAAALAQLAGLGGGGNPLDSVRSALGLDELSLGGSGSGPPSVQAGRYIAPGVYVGATQATSGQGTQATVQINLYKGLKLETITGSSGSGSGDASSIGLTYQFNY